MATYDEISALASQQVGASLVSRIQVAAVVAAEKISREDAGIANHTNRLKWAKTVFENPATAGRNLVPVVLVKAMAFTSAQIAGATDAMVQTYVDASVDVLAQG